jgi:hypothetical protein
MRRRESEEGKNRYKRIVMVQLKIQEKKKHIRNTMFRNHKKFSLLVKVLELFLRCPILVLVYKWKLMWSHQVSGLRVAFHSSFHKISWNCEVR